MASLREYYHTKDQIRELSDKLARLEQDPALQDAFKLVDELQTLMNRYDASPVYAAEVLEALDPGASKGLQNTKPVSSNRQAPVKVYRNPHTGEEVRTRGGNHKVLNQWRQEYGKEEVKGWREQ